MAQHLIQVVSPETSSSSIMNETATPIFSQEVEPSRQTVAEVRVLASRVFLGITLVLLAFASPVIYSVDGNSMLAVAVSLVTKGNFTVPPGLGMPGTTGVYYSKWYPLLSTIATPFVAIGVSIANLWHLPVFYTAGAFALLLTPLLTAATAYLVVLLAARLGASPSGAVLAGICYVSGTIALVYAREFFAEPLLALITVVAIYFELGPRRQQKLASVLAGLAVLAKPTGIVVGPVLGAYTACRERSVKSASLPLLGTVAGMLIYAIYNLCRFGSPFTFGQSAQLLGLRNLPRGVLTLLLGTSRGLVWYCPPILGLFGLGRKLAGKPEVVLVFSLFLGYLCIYSMWSNPEGGWSWGPRYLLPALPGLLALCGLVQGPWRKRLIALTMLGFIVNAPTLISYYERIYQEDLQAERNPASDWSFSRAPFVEIWGSAARELRDAEHTDVKTLVRQAGEAAANRPENWRTLRIVNVWWWMLPVLSVPRQLGAAISVLLTLTGVYLILSALMRGKSLENTLRGTGSIV